MKSLLILSCVVALSSSMRMSHNHGHTSHRMLPAIRNEAVHDDYHQYAFRYITARNTVVSDGGRIVPSLTGGYVLKIEGIYSPIGDEDQFHSTKYRGGIGGLHQAAHLPRPVPVARVFRNKIRQ